MSKRMPRLRICLSFPWILLFLTFQYLSTAATTRIFGEVVVTAIFVETPLEVIIISMFLITVMLCLHEPEVVARINELLLPIIVLPLVVIAFASFQQAEWDNLLPIFSTSWKNVFRGGIETAFSYQGYELMLIYFAFAQRGSNPFKATRYGITFSMFVYMLIVLASITVFGHEEIQRLAWPTLELVKTTQMPGLILERLESAFLGVWVAAVFTTTANTYYVVVYGLRQWLGRGMMFQRIIAALLLIPLFYISLIPQNVVQLSALTDNLAYMGLIVTTFLPLVYALVTLMRYGRGEHAESMEEVEIENAGRPNRTESGPVE